ncbi:MFS transporter [Halovibrio salipaludis]|uniref:MFS transporter n=1 Tax=Halovibrio salipaludis TaxID=2032626 RepID=A0A2A2FAB9_9GAMM|nr:MFS transporter [Halovibrio salipaludis]PAU82441.1 MFS transporter [Halovibrio salipaludis]
MERQFWVSITALMFSIGVLLLGVGLMGTLLSVRLSFEDMSGQAKGLVLSAYYIGLVIGSQKGGWVIRQAGHIRAFAIFAALCTVAILLQGLYVSGVSWFLLRILIGFSTSGIYMVVESWLNERAEPSNRGTVFSAYQIITYGGIGLGQFLMHLGDPQGAELFMIVGVLFALCLVPVALSRASNPPEPLEQARMALGQTWRDSHLAVITCLGAGLLSGAVYTLIPLAALRMNLAVSDVAPLMAGLVLGGVALQWPIGHFSDRFGRRPLILLVAAATTLVTVAMMAAAGRVPLWPLVGLSALLGGFVFTLYPLSVALANDSQDEGNFVGVSAALIFLWGIGAATSPIVGGAILARTPPGGLFIYMGVISAVLAIAALMQPRHLERIRSPFRMMTRSAPTLVDLDPRAHEEEDAGPEVDPPEWYR